MIKILILFILTSAIAESYAAQKTNCRDLMTPFISTSTTLNQNVRQLKNSWNKDEKKIFFSELEKSAFGYEKTQLIIESLNLNSEKIEILRVQKYLNYVLTLNTKEQKDALLDLAQLDAREIFSPYVKKFINHENIIKEKLASKKISSIEKIKRYEELYYGCRSFRPNDVNQNAVRDFKRFNLSLNLGTLAASYAFYNMDKDIDAEWFKKLGYDIGVTLLFSYVGGNIQTKITDTQITKSLKGYFYGRIMGLTDVFIYGTVFNHEREEAEKRFEKLKKDPINNDEINKLLRLYEKRDLYRKYKNELISNLKKLPHNISLGLKGNSIDENNVDWNNLTKKDLEREEVQEVLVAASMAEIYAEKKGEWIETGDAGLDRYVFNSIFFAVQIPKSITQNFITYRMLCMGQDDPKISFAKAVFFNVSTSFLVNQVFYGQREKAINQ